MYQNPRINVEEIKSYYDDEYIAHRKKTDWGILQPFYQWAMGKHDRDKDKIVSRYVDLGPETKVLDVGCAVGTFLTYMREKYSIQPSGVDFKDCSYYEGFEHIDFHCGLFYEQDLPENHFDLITMWHFLEHDYDPFKSLDAAKRVLSDTGRMVIEVPRLDSQTYKLYQERWPGLQAPQHTVCFDRDMLIKFVEKAGLEVVDYLPYGAFPAYFYLFTGAAFKMLKGKGLDLDRWVMPYFAGQLLTAPVMAFEKRLNLAMQTVVVRKPPIS
jgi:SAM-dependent methyltransferase